MSKFNSSKASFCKVKHVLDIYWIIWQYGKIHSLCICRQRMKEQNVQEYW